MLLVAFVCAAAAAVLIHTLLKRKTYQDEAAMSQSAPRATRKLVVAARDVKAGEKLGADMLREIDWPAETLPKGAFLDKGALLKVAADRIVLESLVENEPLLPRKVSGLAESGPLSAMLGDGMRALTIRVSEDSGVGGFAQPGDRVDVLLTQSNARAESGGPAKAYTATLVQNVRVLAADQSMQRKEKATPPKAVTLEVTAEDAQKLVLGSAIGQLSLTLNRDGARFDRVTGVIQLNDLVEAGPDTAPIKSVPETPVVGVTRSVERKEYRVLPEEISR